MNAADRAGSLSLFRRCARPDRTPTGHAPARRVDHPAPDEILAGCIDVGRPPRPPSRLPCAPVRTSAERRCQSGLAFDLPVIGRERRAHRLEQPADRALDTMRLAAALDWD